MRTNKHNRRILYHVVADQPEANVWYSQLMQCLTPPENLDEAAMQITTLAFVPLGQPVNHVELSKAMKYVTQPLSIFFRLALVSCSLMTLLHLINVQPTKSDL